MAADIMHVCIVHCALWSYPLSTQAPLSVRLTHHSGHNLLDMVKQLVTGKPHSKALLASPLVKSVYNRAKLRRGQEASQKLLAEAIHRSEQGKEEPLPNYNAQELKAPYKATRSEELAGQSCAEAEWDKKTQWLGGVRAEKKESGRQYKYKTVWRECHFQPNGNMWTFDEDEQWWQQWGEIGELPICRKGSLSPQPSLHVSTAGSSTEKRADSAPFFPQP